MANVWKGTFDIELGGETLKLRPSFDAICEFEDKTGVEVSVAQRRLAQEGEVGFKIVVAAIWSGVQGEFMATNQEVKANSPDYQYRIIGEKIRQEGLANFAVIASKFLTYAIIPEDTIRQIEEEVESGKEKKK